MGIYIGRSRCSYEKPTVQVIVQGNPNPKDYIINESLQVGAFLIVVITYPDCKNFEGRKVLLYKDCTIEDLKAQKDGIDPHFFDKKTHKSPIARFEPTEMGVRMAAFVAHNYKG